MAFQTQHDIFFQIECHSFIILGIKTAYFAVSFLNRVFTAAVICSWATR
jgi:hypothetical protein